MRDQSPAFEAESVDYSYEDEDEALYEVNTKITEARRKLHESGKDERDWWEELDELELMDKALDKAEAKGTDARKMAHEKRRLAADPRFLGNLEKADENGLHAQALAFQADPKKPLQLTEYPVEGEVLYDGADASLVPYGSVESEGEESEIGRRELQRLREEDLLARRLHGRMNGGKSGRMTDDILVF